MGQTLQGPKSHPRCLGSLSTGKIWGPQVRVVGLVLNRVLDLVGPSTPSWKLSVKGTGIRILLTRAQMLVSPLANS